jgi:Co/Zn/Cd efflux system component
MTVTSQVAPRVKTSAFLLQSRFRDEHLILRSVWLCRQGDFANIPGVLLAAGLVAAIGTRWPDLIIGLMVAALFLQTSSRIRRSAWRKWRTGIPTQMNDANSHAATLNQSGLML